MIYKLFLPFEVLKKEREVFQFIIFILSSGIFISVPLLLYVGVMWINHLAIILNNFLIIPTAYIIYFILISTPNGMSNAEIISLWDKILLSINLVFVIPLIIGCFFLGFLGMIKFYIPRKVKFIYPDSIRICFYFFLVWSFSTIILNILLQLALIWLVGEKEFTFFNVGASTLYVWISQYFIQVVVFYVMLRKEYLGFSIRKREIPL